MAIIRSIKINNHDQYVNFDAVVRCRHTIMCDPLLQGEHAPPCSINQNDCS